MAIELLIKIIPFAKTICELISKFRKTYSPAIQKLLSQQDILFKEIIEAIGKEANEPYTEEEVLHHLFRALWRGEFEDDEGESRLWLPSCNGPLRIGLEGQVFYLDEHKNPSPPIKQTFSRRLLLLMPGIDIGQIYLLPLEELNNDQLSWEIVKNLIDWEVLALIEPQNYGDLFVKAYLKELRMPQKDFEKWLKNFRKGKYAQ